MELVTLFQIQNEDVCVSLYTNAFEKDMNSSVLPPSHIRVNSKAS